ncbi:alcohol dehydrogenase catalytic domain-containing protein [bacterium]|nr:alcohol dehydrogenase catalytic domain-containing protein [bacterium]
MSLNDYASGLYRWDVTGRSQLSRIGFSLTRMKPGQVLLQFLANGICGSDTHMYHTGATHSAHQGPTRPLTLGHELVARVVKKSKKVRHLEVGDVVAVEPGVPCEKCPDCRRGRYNCCSQVLYMGTPPQSGGLATQFYWPAQWCHKVPDKIAGDPVLASLTEPLAACRQACVLRSRRCPDRLSSDWTIIVGGGAMAMGVLAVLKAMNPDEQVMVLARRPAALDFAMQMGANACVPLCSVSAETVVVEVMTLLDDFIDNDIFDDSKAVNLAEGCSPEFMLALEAALEAVRSKRSRAMSSDSLRAQVAADVLEVLQTYIELENLKAFQFARQFCGGFITSAFECTGDEPLLRSLIHSRCLLGDSCIIGLGCHYGISFDVAMLRRSELNFQTVRRSCRQFPATLELLARNPDYFRKLIGGTVPFDQFGDFMRRASTRVETGSGGPKTVVTA